MYDSFVTLKTSIVAKKINKYERYKHPHYILSKQDI